MRHDVAMWIDVPVGPRTPALPNRAALVPLGQRDPLTAMDARFALRAAAYAAFGRQAAALCERLDALTGAGALPSPVHLSLEGVHRRGWGSCSAALNKGALDPDALEARLAPHPLAVAADGPLMYGVDTSGWPRCDAETRPARGCSHHASRHSAGTPIVAGWSFPWVAQLRLTRARGTAPLSVRRGPPGSNVNAAAAVQIKDVVARRPADGQVPRFAFDFRRRVRRGPGGRVLGGGGGRDRRATARGPRFLRRPAPPTRRGEREAPRGPPAPPRRQVRLRGRSHLVGARRHAHRGRSPGRARARPRLGRRAGQPPEPSCPGHPGTTAPAPGHLAPGRSRAAAPPDAAPEAAVAVVARPGGDQPRLDTGVAGRRPPLRSGASPAIRTAAPGRDGVAGAPARRRRALDVAGRPRLHPTAARPAGRRRPALAVGALAAGGPVDPLPRAPGVFAPSRTPRHARRATTTLRPSPWPPQRAPLPPRRTHPGHQTDALSRSRRPSSDPARAISGRPQRPRTRPWLNHKFRGITDCEVEVIRELGMGQLLLVIVPDGTRREVELFATPREMEAYGGTHLWKRVPPPGTPELSPEEFRALVATTRHLLERPPHR